MSEEVTGNPEKAAEILRRRGERTSKLQRVIDRGSLRSQAENSVGEKNSIPADMTGTEQGRPAKPIRITVDLNATQHRFLREYCLNTGTKGTAALRCLLYEMAENRELRSRMTQRLKR